MSRTTEPTQITQGERVEWTKSIADYPAGEYTLVYRYRPQAGNGFDVTATADGDDFNAVITAAVSAAIPNAALGDMAWQSWLTEIADSTNTFLYESGKIKVLQGFNSTSLAAVDSRSDAKIALDAINAAIKGMATVNQLEYEITTSTGGRKIKRVPMADLLAARKEYAAIVNAENNRERMRNGGPVLPSIRMRVYDE